MSMIQIARVALISGSMIASTLVASNAFAGGFVGDVLRITGQDELADTLDDTNRQLKNAFPGYADFEDGITNTVRVTLPANSRSAATVRPHSTAMATSLVASSP